MSTKYFQLICADKLYRTTVMKNLKRKWIITNLLSIYFFLIYRSTNKLRIQGNFNKMGLVIKIIFIFIFNGKGENVHAQNSQNVQFNWKNWADKGHVWNLCAAIANIIHVLHKNELNLKKLEQNPTDLASQMYIV